MLTSKDANGDYLGLGIEEVAHYVGKQSRQTCLVQYETVVGGKLVNRAVQLTPQQVEVLSQLREKPGGWFLSPLEETIMQDVPTELLYKIPQGGKTLAGLSTTARKASYDLILDRI